ncbi:MAG: PAS domain S-box protein [Candidatus Omnitrophica bacterium]|jgi:PAS domain S-box-containing protein|nr:PAS domain S-box protein [Candidatus Omnitrophota bacterium]
MKNTFYLNISSADNLGIGLFKYAFLPQERFIIVNSALSKMLGLNGTRELKKVKLANFFANLSERDEFFKRVRMDGKVNFFEAVFKTLTGRNLWVAITCSLIASRDKKEYLEGIIENISTHKEMEGILSLERDFLQGLLDNLPDAMYFKDCNNRIIKVNKFYAQGVGLKSEEIVGKTDFDFFPAQQAQQMSVDDNYVLTTGKPIIGKIEHTLLPDGTWNQAITTKIPMYDKNAKIIGTMGITRDMTAYANLEKERLLMLINTLKILGKALEMRDPYTFSHTRHVANIAEIIAKELNWDENRLLGIKLAGELHDLGKISIPLDILNKPGKLSDLEYGIIQEHAKNCYDLIKDIEFPFPLSETIYQHHERLDGSGYPRKLKGDAILFEARILAVSDVLESMTQHRPYREALGITNASKELCSGRGLRYDSKIVDVALNLIKESGDKVFWKDN